MADLQRIQFKRSSVAGKKPTTAQLAVGELAINLTDRTLYTSTGTAIVDLGFGKGGQVDGDITATGTIKATKLEGPLTGNADSATKLATARTIGGVSFNGTANINLPGVNTAGNQNTSGNAATATKLQTARTINGVSFDGTANIEVPIKTIRTTAIETDDLSESVFFRSDAGSGTLGIHIHNPVDSRYAYQLSQDSSYNSIGLKARVKSAGTWSDYKSLAFTDSDITGNAATATKLQTVRTLSWTGDATGSLTFDGTANRSAVLTLANSGVSAGTYKSVTVDTKGRVTAGTNVVTGLVTSTAASGTTNAATSNTNTYLNIVETIGSAATTVGTSTQVIGAGTVTVTSDTAGKLTITGSQNITGNAATATKLAVRNSINGTAFDGSSDITIAEPTFSGYLQYYQISDYNNISTNGFNVKYGLQTATNRPPGTDHAVVTMSYSSIWTAQQAFDWRTNASYIRCKNNGVWTAWKQLAFTDDNITGNASTATALQTARSINGVLFNGTANITVYDTTKLPTTGGTITGNLTVNGSLSITSFQSASPYSFLNGGSAQRIMTGGVLASNSYSDLSKVPNNGIYSLGQIRSDGGFVGNLSGNASTASSAAQLTTARTIGGVLFNGTSNINLPGVNIVGNQSTTGNASTATRLQTARAIGITGSGVSGSVSFDGSGNVNIPLTVSTQATTTNNTTIATTAFVQAVNSADTGSAATALKLKTARTINGVSFDGSANINLPLLGYNQTWQHFVTGRNLDTVYTNSTAYPIYVTVAYEDYNGRIEVLINGVQVFYQNRDAGNGAWFFGFIVPVGQTYKITIANGTGIRWCELR